MHHVSIISNNCITDTMWTIISWLIMLAGVVLSLSSSEAGGEERREDYITAENAK